MRKFIVFAAACFMITCSFLLIVPTASAATNYSGAWVPTPQSTSTMTIEATADTNYSFGIYDWGQPNDFLILGSGSGFHYETLTFTHIEGSSVWDIATVGHGDITLNGSNEFGFFFSPNSAGLFPEYLYQFDEFSSASYKLYWNNHELVVHEASPVPIPTAALLLGSDLVGLVGFRRKRKSS